VWTGALSGVWDRNTTANFKLGSDATPANFYQSDSVLFDDQRHCEGDYRQRPTHGRNLFFNNAFGNDYTINPRSAVPAAWSRSAPAR
jgi:hypothetical protein